MSQAIQVDTTFSEKYYLQANPAYTHSADELSVPIETAALASEVRLVEASTDTPLHTVFDVHLDPGSQMVSTAFKVLLPINFRAELETASDVDITEVNFLDKFFNGFSEFCISDGGITNAIQDCEIRLDNKNLTVSDYKDICRIVSPYYSSQMTDEYTQSSIADVFPSFEHYDITNKQPIKYYSEFGDAVFTNGAAENKESPFIRTFTKDRNSRTPSVHFLGAEGKNILRFRCYFWAYLNLNIATLPNAPSTLAGIKKLTVRLQMDANLPSLVFNIKKNGIAHRYKLITLDTNSTEYQKAKLYTQLYTPPPYMLKQFKDANDRFTPYQVHIPYANLTVCNSYPAKGNNQVQFNSTANISTGSIPKSLYVAIVPEREGSFKDVANIPNYFGLITDLTVKVNSQTTNFPDIAALNHLTSLNGYDKLSADAKLMAGFPIRIDFTKDLNLNGEYLIGQTSSATITVSGHFKHPNANRLETESTQFKLVVVTVEDSVLRFDGNAWHSSIGANIPQELLSTNLKETLFMNQHRDNKILGAGILSDAWKWGKKNIVPIAQSAWRNKEKIAKQIGDVVALAKTLKGAGGMESFGAGQQYNAITGAGEIGQTVFNKRHAFK